MARPAVHMTPKTTDYRTVDLAWLRRKGARHVGYSGQITWRNRGEVTGSIGYRLESGGLRLIYRTRPMPACRKTSTTSSPSSPRACISEASGTGFHVHRAGAGVAFSTAVRASGAGCAEARGTKASIKPQR
jgi:hypothetical protein